jgi:hypothetical protein
MRHHPGKIKMEGIESCVNHKPCGDSRLGCQAWAKPGHSIRELTTR